mgnify:CR=1 FL=1
MDALIKIKCIRGKLEGESWEYVDENQTIKIGRNKDSDILIPAEDTTVSRKQCEIRISNDKIILIDGDGERKSTQGTWVDNKKITKECQLEGEHQLGVGVAGNAEIFAICVWKEKNSQLEDDEKKTVAATIGVEKLDGIESIEDIEEQADESASGKGEQEEKKKIEENLKEEKKVNQEDIKAKKEPRIAELLSLLFLVFHYILQKTFSGTLWKL